MTIIAPSDFFYIGLTHLTLTCVISLNSTSDIDVRPEDLDITWLRGGTVLFHNDSQVTALNTSGNKLQFLSNLTLSPLGHMDTIFTCRARVIPLRRTNFITDGELGQFVKVIRIQCKPHILSRFSILAVKYYMYAVRSAPLMPLLEQLTPLAFRVSWDPPLGVDSSGSSTTYNISCQSLKRGIDSPPPVITEPGQTNTTLGNLDYGVTYNCSIVAQLPQILSQPEYISITTMEIGMNLKCIYPKILFALCNFILRA